MLGCCLLVDVFIDKRLVSLIIQVIVGVTIYFSTLFILKDRFLIDLIKENVINKIKKAN